MENVPVDRFVRLRGIKPRLSAANVPSGDEARSIGTFSTKATPRYPVRLPYASGRRVVRNGNSSSQS